MVITDDKNVVRMAVTPPIVYEAKDPEKDPVVVNITRVIGTPTIDVEKDKISMTARFSFQQTVSLVITLLYFINFVFFFFF